MRKGKTSMIQSCLLGMRDVRTLDRRKPWLIMGRAVTSIVLTYLYILLTSVILSDLTNGAELPEILAVIGAGLFLILLVSVFSHGLERKDRVLDAGCLRAYRQRKSRKLLELSFEELESVETRKTLARLQTEESVGYGISTLLQHFGTLAKQLLLVVISLVMLAVLAGSAGKGVLDYVWMLLFGAAMTLLSLGAAVMIKRANDASLTAIRSIFPPNIIINDYLTSGDGIRYRDGKDIRFYQYRQQIENVYSAAVKEMKGFDGVGGRYPALAAGLGGAVQGVTLCASYLFVLLVWEIGYQDLGWALVLASALYQLSVSLAGAAGVLSQCSAAADSVHAYMQFTEPEPQAVESRPGQPEPQLMESVQPAAGIGKGRVLESGLKVEKLSFQYPGTDGEILHGISFEIPRGGRVALVGANGSGKTTLVKLLCGLYRPQPGRIFLNGKDALELSEEEYREYFSAVFQDFKLFSFPLGETVASASSYNEKDVVRALSQAGMEEKAASWPEGLDTYLYKDFADGIELSGGEAQKVALARALYRDAPVLILDEPTAALDPLAEAEIYDRINRLSRDKTVLFVSHRLSACRFCDEILVLSEGSLVQKGCHEELLSEGGLYRDMWEAQAHYYIDESNGRK